MDTERSQKQTASLPPGLVPSQSQEEFVFNVSRQHHRHDVLKDVNLGENVSADHGVLASEHSPTASGTPPEAWMPPDNGRYCTADSSVRKGVITSDTTETKQYDSSSLFTMASKHPGIDLHKELVPEGNEHPAPTFKRPMSPFRRVNKVAPSPAKPLVIQQDGCNLLSKRMGNVKESQQCLPRLQHTYTSSTPSRVSPVVEPVYSTVVKTKSHKKTPQSPTSPDKHRPQTSTTMEPDTVAILPKLECYETQKLDNSLVIVNNSTTEYAEQSPGGHESPPPIPPYMGEEDDTVIYEEIDRPGVNSAMYKELKKHQDVGNVQLVSVRSTSDLPQSQSMNFPNGNSTDMQSIHYAASIGDKKALAEILSTLPVQQDTKEKVLSGDRMCRRQGIDVRDSEGRTAFMHAVHNNHTDCVKLLAKQGANVNGIADDGSSPLHKTAYSGTLEMLALLLNLGANGLLRDKDGRTPLHWCTNNPDPECIKILLDKIPSLDVNVLDASLMTPLMWAAFHGKPDNIKVLKEQGAGIDVSTDQTLHDVDGMTALHWSVQRHDTRALQALINVESSEFTDHIGKTVMHQAAEQGCARAVGLIQAIRPTSVNDIDANGRTPLHWATVCENPDVIRALLAHGADPMVKDSSVHTPLDYATEKGLHYCGLLLAKAEQSIDHSDQSYHTPLTYGTSVATIGASTQTQEDGQLQTFEESLTREQMVQIQGVYAGAWMNKFTKSGKGPLHPRLFWVEPENKICWTKSSDKLSKDTRKEYLVGVRSSASPTVIGRKDFEPLGLHKYAFTILTATRVLDVVAVSSEDYKIWLNGLQLLLDLGGTNANALLTSSVH